MTSTVFRVEHKIDGEGCYKDRGGVDNFLDNMHERHSNDIDEHPNPQADVGINRCINNFEYCGFENMESLRRWFTEDDLIELAWLDYEIIELNGVEITAVGKKQVLFIKPEPEKILEKSENILDIEF